MLSVVELAAMMEEYWFGFEKYQAGYSTLS